MHKVLFTKISLDTMDGKYDYIANHIIQLHNFDDEWSEKNPQLVGFSFRSDDIDSFNTVELKALKMLYGKIIGSKNVKSPLFSNGYNEDTGILTISAKTVDEELSIAFTKLVYNQLKEYYVSSTTKGSAYTFQYAKEKTDSIFSLLRAKEYQLSKFDDSHRFLTDPNLLTQRKLIETEIFKLKTMYGESTKNLEIANYTLEAGMPDITIIDEPIPPIDAMSESWLISFIKGGILGGLIGISFVLGRKIIRDALAT